MTSYPVPDATGLVKLDAMENPYRLPADLAAQLGEHLADVALNRYPAPRPTALLEKIKRVMQRARRRAKCCSATARTN